MSDHLVGGNVSAKMGAACKEQEPAEDMRELLVNDGAIGPAEAIAVSLDEVACVRAFMADIDLSQLEPAVIGSDASENSTKFYHNFLANCLSRHPVLQKAEVRASSQHGVHVIWHLERPQVLKAGEALLYDRLIRGLRVVLPSDPNCNGLIAMTRPVGAKNKKYSPPQVVDQLRSGEPVTRDEILSLAREISDEPASTLMRVLYGGKRVTPCPFCQKNANSLGVAGRWRCCCYDCGSINAAELLGRFYRGSRRQEAES